MTFAAPDVSVRVWASGVSCKSPMTTLHPFDCRSFTNSRPMPLLYVSGVPMHLLRIEIVGNEIVAILSSNREMSLTSISVEESFTKDNILVFKK